MFRYNNKHTHTHKVPRISWPSTKFLRNNNTHRHTHTDTHTQSSKPRNLLAQHQSVKYKLTHTQTHTHTHTQSSKNLLARHNGTKERGHTTASCWVRLALGGAVWAGSRPRGPTRLSRCVTPHDTGDHPRIAAVRDFRFDPSNGSVHRSLSRLFESGPFIVRFETRRHGKGPSIHKNFSAARERDQVGEM
jgi:hypothetical protein